MEDEILDENIRYWYSQLPVTVKTSKVTKQQKDYILAFMTPSSDSYGNKKLSALKAGCSYGIPPRITKNKVDRIMMDNRHRIKNNAIPDAIEKPTLVNMAKGVLYKAMEQEDDLHLAQDTAKFVLKSTKEFAEKQDMTSDGQSINGLNISFASFKKPEEIKEADIVERTAIEDKSKIRRSK